MKRPSELQRLVQRKWVTKLYSQNMYNILLLFATYVGVYGRQRRNYCICNFTVYVTLKSMQFHDYFRRIAVNERNILVLYYRLQYTTLDHIESHVLIPICVGLSEILDCNENKLISENKLIKCYLSPPGQQGRE